MNSLIRSKGTSRYSFAFNLRLSAISFFSILSVFVVFLPNVLAASPGALDLSFGTVGVVTENSDGITTLFKAVQTDGKVLSVGNTSPSRDFMIRRYNSDGSIDNSFGTNGIVITDFDGQEDFARSVEVLSDGKILVGGYGNSSGGSAFKIARYQSDGSLDTSFGTGGKAIATFSGYSFDFLSGMTVQADGKIVITSNDSGINDIVISRLNSNGAIDSTFGTNGLVILQDFSVGGNSEIASVQSNGKIIIAGQKRNSSTNSLTVYRLNIDGSVDTSFGVNGEFTVDEPSVNRPKILQPKVVIQPDDKVIISGLFRRGGTDLNKASPPLLRLNADGTADSSFISNTNTDSSQRCISCTSHVKNLMLRSDGKFYVVGSSGNVDHFFNIEGLSITLYNSDGSIDTNFAFNGTHYVHKIGMGSASSVGKAFVHSDGKVIIGVDGTIVAGGTGEQRIIRLNPTKTPATTRGDFDGDKKTDFAIFRPSEGNWYVLNSSDNSYTLTTFGAASHNIVPGDYNYDGKTDIATFTETQWWVTPSQPGNGNFSTNYGVSGDVAVSGDYDGDGLTDLANFRPSDGNWYIRYSTYNHLHYLAKHIGVINFGLSSDKPVPGDYDGDGRTDVAMYRPSNGGWYILRSSDNQVMITQWGINSDKPVQADYDGDGKTDLAIYRDGIWYVLNSSDGNATIVQFGVGDDKPVPGDYDGDGKTDFAVFRSSEGVWYVYKSSDSGYLISQWGIDGDIPIPSKYVP